MTLDECLKMLRGNNGLDLVTDAATTIVIGLPPRRCPEPDVIRWEAEPALARVSMTWALPREDAPLRTAQLSLVWMSATADRIRWRCDTGEGEYLVGRETLLPVIDQVVKMLREEKE